MPIGSVFLFGGTIRGMGCGGSFTRSFAVGAVRPRREGKENDECNSTKSPTAREILRDERECGPLFSWHSAFAAPAIKHLVGSRLLILLQKLPRLNPIVFQGFRHGFTCL